GDECEAALDRGRQVPAAEDDEAEHLEAVGAGRQQQDEGPAHAGTSSSAAGPGTPTRTASEAHRIGTPIGVKGMSARQMAAPSAPASAPRRVRSSGHTIATNAAGKATSRPKVSGSIASP